MSDIPERFYVPTGPKLIDGFRAFRSYLEKVAAARGKTLAPAWYQDSPEEAPQLYKDQPDLLAELDRKKNEGQKPE